MMRFLRAVRLPVAIGAAALCASCYDETSPAENKDPRAWISLEVDAGNLPIPVDAAALSVTYTIGNPSCLKPMPISGAITPPFYSTSFDVHKSSSHTFAATVAADRFEDKDYDGRGICHWRIATARFTMKHGARELTASMPGQTILGQGSVQRYFSEWAINSAPTDRPQPGIGDPGVAQRGDAGKLYTVTVTAKEAKRE